jgi:hypothetical protein
MIRHLGDKIMHKTSLRVQMCAAVAVLGLTGIATGCGERAALLGPSPVGGGDTSASIAAAAGANGPSSELVDLGAPGAAAHLSPTELQMRGWTCFQPPVPNRIVCSRPHQGRPTIGFPPPEDRPSTFTFLVFDGSGAFAGTELLIRSDLYRGQLCESTGEPFVFRAAIGYYECVRTVGPNQS